jgi:hypothetical protein
MLEYIFDGQTFNVHPSQKDNFLQKYPKAQLVGEPQPTDQKPIEVDANFGADLVKQEDPVKETAVAGSEDTSSMDSTLDPGSSELEKPKKPELVNEQKLYEVLKSKGLEKLLLSGGNIEEKNKLYDAVFQEFGNAGLHLLEKEYISRSANLAKTERERTERFGIFGDVSNAVNNFFGKESVYNYGNDTNEVYTEERNRSNPLTPPDAISELMTFADPYIFSNEYYENAPKDLKNIVFTYGQELDKKYKNKATGLDILAARDMYLNDLANNQYNTDIKTKGGENQHTSFVLSQGDGFLSNKEKEYIELRKKYEENKSPELAEKLESFGFGNQLYDAATGNIVSLDKASPEAIETSEKAEQLAETTELEELNKGLSKSYSKLIAASKGAYDYIVNEIGIDKFKNESQSGAASMISSARDLFGADDTINDDLENLSKINSTGTIPNNISLMPGSHPAATFYNNALKEYLAYNRAVKLNVDPVSTEKDGILMGAWENIVKKVDGQQGLTSKFEAADNFVKAINGSTDLKFIDPQKVDERLTEDFLDARTIGSGTVDLSAFVAEIALFRKASGNAVTKGFNKLSKAVGSTKFAKNHKNFKRASELVIGGLDEAVTFVGVEAIKGASGEELEQTSTFGFGLGVGNTFAKKVTGRVFANPKIGKTMNRLNQYHTSAFLTNNLIGSTTGSSVYHFAQATTDNEEFMKLLEGGENDMYGQKLLESFLSETAKMAFLGFGKRGFNKGGLTGIYDSMRRDIYQMKGKDATSLDAAKRLEFDHTQIDNKSDKAQTNITKAYNKKVKNINKQIKDKSITEEKGKELLKEAEKDALILENKLGINLFKEKMDAEKDKNGNFVESEYEAARIGQKLLKGEELTLEENKKFSHLNIGFMLNSMGVQGRKLMGDNNVKQSLLYNQFKAATIEDILNKSELKTDYLSKERSQVYEYVSKVVKAEENLNRLKNQENLSDAGKTVLERLQKEYDNLRNGPEYKKINKVVENYTKERYKEDIAFAKEILQVTGQSKGLKQAQTKKEFQKLYNGAGLKSKNVTENLAFYNPKTQKMVINKAKALEQRTITTAKHEVLHHVLRDVLKKNGKITKEGIKIIDDVLNELTPEQRKVIQKRIDDNYRFDEKTGEEKAKEDYYEEYLTSLSEAISTGEIQFKENIGKSLLDFIPGMKEKGFENLEIGVETGRQLFNLIKSYSKNETLGIEAAKAISKDAPVKGLKGETKASKISSEISSLAVKYKDNNLTPEETKKFRNQYIAAGKDALGRWAAKKGVPVNAIKNNTEVEGKLIDQFGSVTKNYKPINPVTGKKQEFTTYLGNILGRRIGTKLVEEYTRSLEKTSVEELKERGTDVKDVVDEKQNIEDAIEVSFGNKNEIARIGNGAPSIIQRNLKVNGKRILSEEDGPALRGEFIDAAIRISEKLIKDLKLPPDSKEFRKQLSKEIAKETELFEEFKEKLDVGDAAKYEAFLNASLPGIIKNPKGLPLSFYVQAEKFSQRLGREPLFVVKEADANPRSKYLKKAGEGYTSENPAAQNYSKATTKAMIELAIKEGKASYTENTANGVFVYSRLDARKESPNKIKDFFKVQNTKERFIKTLFNQAMIDAVIGQRKKNLYSVTEKAKIAEKAQKEHDVFFSREAEGVRRSGMGPEGFYKDGPSQNKAHTNLIKRAVKLAKEGKIDKAFLEIITAITNTAPTGLQVNRGTPDVFEGKKRSSKDPKKITEKLLPGDYRVSREDFNYKPKELKEGSGYTLTLLEAGYLWNVEKLGNIVKETFGKQEFTDAIKHGKSSQERGDTKTMEALSKKNFTKEELTKEVIDWYIENAIELHKIDSRAAWDLLYNQNASSGINRQLSKVILHELGTKKIDTRLEHLLQNGVFNTLIQDMAKMSEAGKNQVKEWIKNSYRQAAISETTRKIVDGTYVIEGREKRWEAAYELPPIIQDAINRIKKGEKNVEIPSIDARLFNRAYGNNTVNPYAIKTFDKNGKIISKAEEYGLGVKANVWRNSVIVQKNAANIIADMIAGKVTRAEGIKRFNKTLPISAEQSKTALKYSKGKSSDIVEVINQKESKNKEIKEEQTARFSKQDISKQFNGFLEKSTGIKKESVFGAATAMARGKQAKTDFGDYFIPVGAEDFAGLMHKTLARGKQGEKQLEFYDKVLYEPYNKAVEAMTNEAMALKNDFKAIKKQLNNVPKTLKQFTEGGVFTKEQAVRVYMWNKLGYEIPGISKKVKSELLKEINKNADLHTFANEILKITKGDGYAKPKESWVAGNIAMDMVDLLNTTKRTKHLEVWQNNVDQIFSKENLFKLEAAYGAKYVKALKGTLQRMKTGSNRKWGANETVEKWNDWINGSVGAIMFLNTRSAVLQTISNINYINFTDNNPLQAAKAFANQKQYWKDFNTLFNSDYLQSRRGGNKINVNESELALAQEKGGVQGVIALMLNKGFVLTRMADSFAIATGGASMYRNRLTRYKKEGMSEKEAEAKAFRDFMKITEETQQSSRPDRISEQQASSLGRFMLAFANTPMQYNRIIKRNMQDLIAGRGDPKEKMTKITYYGMIQNIIFNALQKALFVSAFSDEEDDEQQKRTIKVGEGMADSLLRGSGLYGNAAVAVKNVAKAIATDARNPELQALTISPPIYSKVSKLRNANYSRKYITPNNMFEPSLDNPALNAGAQFSSAVFNFPLDRAIRKAQNIEAAMSEGPEYWQRVALTLGWGEWELGIEDDKKKKKKVKQYDPSLFTRSNRDSGFNSFNNNRRTTTTIKR